MLPQDDALQTILRQFAYVLHCVLTALACQAAKQPLRRTTHGSDPLARVSASFCGWKDDTPLAVRDDRVTRAE